MKATWNGTVIAESDDTVVVEGNHYFPADAVKPEFYVDSKTSIVVDGQTNADAAWYYPTPKDAAQEIKDRIAFWRGVQVTA
jgi:uncharacterized protein (DUF427 family)